MYGSYPISPFWKENSARLQELWLLGKTGREIAEELGCSRNMVLGRAHRMGLPDRPSPIIRKPKPNPHIPDIYLGRQERTCEWPSGEPGTDSYSECGKPTHGHAPYCEEHCRKAVRRPASGEQPVVYGQWGKGPE